MTPRQRYARELLAQASYLTQQEQAEWAVEIEWALRSV